MSGQVKFSALWIVGLLALAVAGNRATAAISCSTALPRLLPCLGFLLGSSNQVTVPCCQGANSLNQIAGASKDDLRALCRCLKQGAMSFHVNVDRAKQLPQLCNIQVPVPIDPNINCDAI